MSDLAEIDERLREIQEMLTRPLAAARVQPSDSAAGARPSDSAAGARPSDSAAGARPSDSAAGARPSDSAAGEQRSDAAAGAQPSDSAAGAQPSDSAAGAQPAGGFVGQPASTAAPEQTSAAAGSGAAQVLRALTGRIEELAAGPERTLVALDGQLLVTISPLRGLDSLERFARQLTQIEGVQTAGLRSYEGGQATFELSLRCGTGGAR